MGDISDDRGKQIGFFKELSNFREPSIHALKVNNLKQIPLDFAARGKQISYRLPHPWLVASGLGDSK